LIYFSVASSIYIISFWLPTIVKQTGVSDPFRIGLVTAIPYTAAIIAMIAVNTNSDRLRERRWHTLVPCIVTAAGLAVTAFATGNTVLAMVGLTLAAAGASSAQAAFRTLPAAFLGGSRRSSRHCAGQLAGKPRRLCEHVRRGLDDRFDAKYIG
jgi:cyanate permease